MYKRLKVLHVINSMLPGGAENLLVNSLTPGGLQDHIDNYLVYLNDDSYLLKKIDAGVKIFNLNYKSKFDLVRALLKLRKIIKKNKIDLIHSHLSPAGFYTSIIRPSNIPHLHTIHTTYSQDRKVGNNLLNSLETKFVFKKRNANIIVISEFNKIDFLDSVNFKGKIYVLNNFIENVFFNNVNFSSERNKNELKVVAIGNLRSEKNYFYLIEIFKFLKNEKIYLDIFGLGDKGIYQQILSEQEINNIHFKGGIAHIHKVINQYDLFIATSKFEGFGLSIFEAIVSGVPVMISNIPSLKSLIKNNAIYFDLDNAKAAADILKNILLNKTDISTMAKTARNNLGDIVRRETYIKSLLKIYNDILKID